MKLNFLSFFIVLSLACSAQPAKTDSTIYQFGNDTILQTLTVKWKSDSVIEYHMLSQDLMDRGSVSSKGTAKRRSHADEPVIKQYQDKEFPADFFISTGGECKLKLYVQYLYKEKVWVERECKNPLRIHKVPMTCVGILEKVN